MAVNVLFDILHFFYENYLIIDNKVDKVCFEHKQFEHKRFKCKGFNHTKELDISTRFNDLSNSDKNGFSISLDYKGFELIALQPFFLLINFKYK